jgi:hypothetical protein
MIHYVHLEDAAVAAARVRSPEVGLQPDPATVAFPGAWPALSFRLDMEDPVDDVDVVIEFEEPQPAATTERVVDALSAWLLASHRGAYADDSFDPSKTAIFLGPDTMSISPERVIWFIEVMRCNEAALDGLLNLLERTHQRIARIRRVEIGPWEE